MIEAFGMILKEPEAFGAFLGALVGLMAILAGALLNAELNRRRDEHLRKNEQQALAAALRGELLAIRTRVAWRYWAFARREKEHRGATSSDSPKWDWTIPDRSIFQSHSEKLLLLDKNLVTKVIITKEV